MKNTRIHNYISCPLIWVLKKIFEIGSEFASIFLVEGIVPAMGDMRLKGLSLITRTYQQIYSNRECACPMHLFKFGMHMHVTIGVVIRMRVLPLNDIYELVLILNGTWNMLDTVYEYKRTLYTVDRALHL